MFPRAIVKAFDIAKDLPLCLVTRTEKSLLHALPFERVDKRLGKSIVPTIAFAAHAGHTARLLQLFSDRMTCILFALIGVENYTRARWMTPTGHRQRLDHQRFS